MARPTLEEIERVSRSADLLYPESVVEAAIDRIAAALTERVGEKNPLLLCVLNGAIIFTGKLLPRLPFPLELESVRVTRYGRSTRGKDLIWRYRPSVSLEGRTVVLLDDVLDEGITLAALKDYCLEEGAREVVVVVLVDKELGVEKPCRADIVGLRCANRYLFGYGMDYKGYLRNAPGIFAVREEA